MSTYDDQRKLARETYESQLAALDTLHSTGLMPTWQMQQFVQSAQRRRSATLALVDARHLEDTMVVKTCSYCDQPVASEKVAGIQPCYYCNKLIQQDEEGRWAATLPSDPDPWTCTAIPSGHRPARSSSALTPRSPMTWATALGHPVTSTCQSHDRLAPA